MIVSVKLCKFIHPPQIKMGASFSITNDTDQDIWVWEDLNLDAILYSTTAVLAVATLGAGVAVSAAGGAAATAGATAASAMASAGTLGSQAGIAAAMAVASTATASATSAATVASAATVVGWVSGASATAISTGLGITKAQAQTLKTNIQYFKDGARHLRPGDVHSSHKLSLSLSKSVWLMNSNGEQTKRTCWTGATNNSNIR